MIKRPSKKERDKIRLKKTIDSLFDQKRQEIANLIYQTKNKFEDELTKSIHDVYVKQYEKSLSSIREEFITTFSNFLKKIQ